MTEAQQQLLDWFDAEYQRRTDLVEKGEGRIDWIAPDYRVSWTEVLSKAEELGITMNPVNLRHWIDYQLTARKTFPKRNR